MNLVRNVLSRIKTSKKRSPLDVSDFVAARPAPAVSALWDRIDARYMGSTMEPKSLEVHKKRMFFDLKYRCGAEGRCLDGDYRCRFPCCFHMRPSVKGGEVFVERLGLEQMVAPRNHDVIKHLDKEELDDAIALIKSRTEEMEGKTAPASMATVTLDEFMNLTLLSAVLLVNLGRDVEAVQLLLQRAPRLPHASKLEVLSAAANWAALSDMEVRFYKVHAQHFPELDCVKMKIEREILLPRVIDACKTDEEAEDHVVHVVLGKEVTCIVARAQNAQDYDDFCEDPMATSVVRDSVDFYRTVIKGKFWAKFFHLAMMPPLDPKADPPLTAPDETPRHVLDAIGRSMLLHHIAKSIDADYDTPTDPKGQKAPQDMTLEEIDRLPREQRVALKRMHELLSVVKNYSSASQQK